MENSRHPGKTVLFADDNASIRQTLGRWLESLPEFRTVLLASDGKEAIDKALSCSPDLAVLDLAMPVMDGLEAARQLKLLNPELPIIIFSMYAESMRMKPEVLHSWGISAVVRKEDATTKLLEKIRELLHLEN